MSAVTTTSSAERGSRRARALGLQRRYPLVQVLVLILLFVYGSASIDGFSSHASVISMLLVASFLGIAGAGQTVVILLGGLDLSVGPTIAASNLMIAQLVGSQHWPFALAAVAIIASGAAFAGLAGWLSIRHRIQPLIVSLGMGAVVLGLALVLIGGSTIGVTPSWLGRFTSVTGKTFGIGIPPVVVVWAALAVVLGVVLHRTSVGRKIYLSGSNPVAAVLAHVNIERVWLGGWIMSGACSSLVGILLAGYSGSGDATIGDPYLFTSIAAVIIGGTSLIGAIGDYWRTCIGALILTVLTTILVGHGANANSQEIVYGAVILAVGAIYGRDRRVRDRV